MSNLSNRLKECMEERNIDQYHLSQETKIERSNISEFLSEKHTPSFENFVALLYFFNCSADYLLGRTDIHTEEPLHALPPFHERLRHILKIYNISQSILIKELPISSSALYKWVSGKSLPSIDSLLRLADYLDCTVDYLIGRVK